MPELTRFAPPGMETSGWKNFTTAVLAGSCLFSASVFFSNLITALALFWAEDPRDTVIGWFFPDVLGNAMFFFPIFAVSMAAFVVLNYLYFFEGSKSHYTMARVKNPWELHIRCWTLPLLGAGVLLVCRVTLTVLYFLIFLLLTPKGAPRPEFLHLIGGILYD